MKKMLLLAGLLVCSIATFATESSNDGSMPMEQIYNQEQVVTAFYVDGGQLVRIKVKINGGFVTHYSTGKDFRGEEQWHFVGNASIRQTNSTLDGEMAREFDYTSTLNISNGYQTATLKIYF